MVRYGLTCRTHFFRCDHTFAHAQNRYIVLSAVRTTVCRTCCADWGQRRGLESAAISFDSSDELLLVFRAGLRNPRDCAH